MRTAQTRNNHSVSGVFTTVASTDADDHEMWKIREAIWSYALANPWKDGQILVTEGLRHSGQSRVQTFELFPSKGLRAGQLRAYENRLLKIYAEITKLIVRDWPHTQFSLQLNTTTYLAP